MQFEVGETVVYPHHGAATITEVKKRVIRGEEKIYLKLNVTQGDLTIEVPADNVAHADEVAVLGRYLDGEVALGNLQNQIELVLTLDGAGLDLLDQCRTVVGVHDRLADCENHVVFSPFAAPSVARGVGSAEAMITSLSQVRGGEGPQDGP